MCGCVMCCGRRCLSDDERDEREDHDRLEVGWALDVLRQTRPGMLGSRVAQAQALVGLSPTGYLDDATRALVGRL